MIFLLAAICFSRIRVEAQISGAEMLSSRVTGNSIQTSPLIGSVPQGTASAEELPLALGDAITRGLHYNLGALLSNQEIRAVQGMRLVALSQLLPNLSLHVTESSQQINLAAMGFSGFPGIPQIVGPFSVSDARATLIQPVINFQAIRNYQAAGRELKAAEHSSRDMREMVVLAITSLYLQVISGESRVAAVQAQLEFAEGLHRQAVNFKQSGVVPAIEVLRAQVQLQSEQQRLIYARNELDKEKLRLGRAIGLPDGQAFRLTSTSRFVQTDTPSLEDALSLARETRPDYQSALAGLEAAESRFRSAKSGHLPSLNFAGDYAVIGQNFSSSHGTYVAAIRLEIPVFQGKRVQGEVLEAQARLEQRRAQLEDLKGKMAFEVRSALLDLKAAEEQVKVSQSAVELANQQVVQSRDRFAAGVTSNLEVVQAQQALAASNETYIASLYAYNMAKAGLAKATGTAEKSIPSILQGVTP